MSGSAGVDLSNYQHDLELVTLSGLDFVIAKCTEAGDIADPSYLNFRAQTKDLGKLFGAYHFLHAEYANARYEAQWFMRHADIQEGMTLWVDYETYGISQETDAESLGLFISTVKLEYPQAKVGIYANWTGLGRIYPYKLEIPYDGFWLADPSIPMTQETEPPWDIHQYETYLQIDRDYCADAPALWQRMGAWK